MWQDDALCNHGVDPELFFSEDTQDVYTAKRLCASCPVRGLCLTAGLAQVDATTTEDADQVGTWGGWSGNELAAATGRTPRFPRKLVRDVGLSLLVEGEPVEEIAIDMGVALSTVKDWQRVIGREQVAA